MKREMQLKLALAVFLTVCAILLFSDTLFGGRVVLQLFSRLVRALRPVLYGAFMAYLLAPMVNFFEERFYNMGDQRSSGHGRHITVLVRTLSILLTWAVIDVLLYLLASVLLPELYRSIVQLVSNVETYYNTITGWVARLLENNPSVEGWVYDQMTRVYKDATKWLTDAIPRAQVLMAALSGGVVSVIRFLGDLLVGFIVSIYFLATKEGCAAHAKKALYALLPKNSAYWTLRGTRKADSIFSGFVRGKLLDSLIIGLLCFVCCSALKFPYTPLVSVVVGITNMIPFFGPFLGAIPSTFLILLVSPIKALYFVIFVLALQQLDGNVIGPKILGDRTGLSSLWVIIAILVGGSFFGLLGMFFGVPVCACLYSLVNFLLDARLRRRDLPTDLAAYETLTPDGPLTQQEKEP